MSRSQSIGFEQGVEAMRRVMLQDSDGSSEVVMGLKRVSSKALGETC